MHLTHTLCFYIIMKGSQKSFSYSILKGNHLIFSCNLERISIRQLLQRQQVQPASQPRAVLLVFENITHAFFIQNCTRIDVNTDEIWRVLDVAIDPFFVSSSSHATEMCTNYAVLAKYNIAPYKSGKNHDHVEKPVTNMKAWRENQLFMIPWQH